MLRSSHSLVKVFSPYLTSPTAESVLKLVEPSLCEIHTVCSLENFVSGASSIKTVKRLIAQGFQVFHVEPLHAKVIIVSGEIATIGSQNVTTAGTGKREASVVFSTPDAVIEIERQMRHWLEDRRLITLNEIADIEQFVNPLKRKHRQLQREIAASAQSALFRREIREKAERERKTKIQSNESRLAQLVPNGVVPFYVSREFIWNSAWWPYHRWGPKRAERHADRIEGAEGDHWVQFGANRFLVSRAVKRCVERAKVFLSRLKEGKDVSRSELLASLKKAIAGSVGKSDGTEYTGPYPLTGSQLRFGTQAIDVDDFISLFMKKSGIDDLIQKVGDD